MLLVNVNGQDAVDIDNVFLILDRDFNPSSAKNDERFISLSRSDKTRSFLVTTDNIIYGLSPSVDALKRKINKAYQDYGRQNPGFIKVGENSWVLGDTKIILLTDSLSRIMQREDDRLKRMDRVFNLNYKKKVSYNENNNLSVKTLKPVVKSYLFLGGMDDAFLIKSNLARATIMGYIKNLNKRGVN